MNTHLFRAGLILAATLLMLFISGRERGALSQACNPLPHLVTGGRRLVDNPVKVPTTGLSYLTEWTGEHGQMPTVAVSPAGSTVFEEPAGVLRGAAVYLIGVKTR
jgi:hypothetical protein